MNQTAELSGFADHKFAIIMLRNANMSSNTINAVVFQLTTNAGNGTKAHTSIEVHIHKDEVDTLEKMMVKSGQAADTEFGKIVAKLK